MSGLASEPSPPASNGSSPSSPDSAPWSDTDLGLNVAPATGLTQTRTPATNKTEGADQLPTIGHIGRYALKYQIGEGGLGRVYAAHDPLLSRLIAIKTLNLEISADERESFNALFLNEARAAGGLSHPHIVTVFDAGVSEQGAYIAMELLKGRDLRQLRLEGWKPTPTQSALIVRRVADALAYAHSKGVVHRDIKPANIFMVGRTQPRVLDFGIARVAHHHEAHAEGEIAGGSPYYMAPEQVRQQPVDRRCDVFSLGVVLYELLTGTRPFRGTTLKEITDAVVDFEPPKAHDVDPGVPKALSDIAARAMEKNPEHRYRSARALARELRHWLEEHAQEAAVEPAEGGAPGKRRLAWVAALVITLVASVAWWLGARQYETTDMAHAPPAAVAARPSAPPSKAAAAASPVVTAATPAPAEASAVAASAVVTAAAASVAVPAVSAAAPAVSPVVAAAASAVVASPPAASAAAPVPVPARSALVQAAKPPKETPKERRAREAREREARLAAAPPPVLASGVLRLAVSPWGQVEIDGKPVGTTPPLNELTLPEGRHTIVIRNDEFPPFSSTIQIVPGQPASLKHRFGS